MSLDIWSHQHFDIKQKPVILGIGMNITQPWILSKFRRSYCLAHFLYPIADIHPMWLGWEPVHVIKVFKK
jgi:hypothetical protein